MTHPTTLISAFLDGELNASEVSLLEGHLATCGRCVADMEDVQRVRSAIRSLPLVELPADLVYEGEPAPVAHLYRYRLVWAGAAAVVAVVITVASLFTPAPASLNMEDLTSRFGARVSLDPAFGSAKAVVPDWDSSWMVAE